MQTEAPHLIHMPEQAGSMMQDVFENGRIPGAMTMKKILSFFSFLTRLKLCTPLGRVGAWHVPRPPACNRGPLVEKKADYITARRGWILNYRPAAAV